MTFRWLAVPTPGCIGFYCDEFDEYQFNGDRS
jgi:hypothetical protein